MHLALCSFVWVVVETGSIVVHPGDSKSGWSLAKDRAYSLESNGLCKKRLKDLANDRWHGYVQIWMITGCSFVKANQEYTRISNRTTTIRVINVCDCHEPTCLLNRFPKAAHYSHVTTCVSIYKKRYQTSTQPQLLNDCNLGWPKGLFGLTLETPKCMDVVTMYICLYFGARLDGEGLMRYFSESCWSPWGEKQKKSLVFFLLMIRASFWGAAS